MMSYLWYLCPPPRSIQYTSSSLTENVYFNIDKDNTKLYLLKNPPFAKFEKNFLTTFDQNKIPMVSFEDGTIDESIIFDETCAFTWFTKSELTFCLYLVFGYEIMKENYKGISLLEMEEDDFTFNEKASQGYELKISSSSKFISVTSTTTIGLFYGVQTLRQIINGVINFPNTCPVGIEIKDSPEFKWRCAQLDISRGRIPTMDFLHDYVNRISHLKYNSLQLYQEGHAFEYNDETIHYGENPLTKFELEEFDEYCRSNFITLIPVQNCLGHLHHTLKKPKYRPLAEREEGIIHPFSLEKEPFSLQPIDEKSINFCVDLITQLTNCLHLKNLVNVWIDECFDVGNGKSRKLVEKIGKGTVCLNHVKALMEKFPEKTFMIDAKLIQTKQDVENVLSIISRLILIEWEYEAGFPWNARLSFLKSTGIKFWIAPGTSSWNSLFGRKTNMIQNITESCQCASYLGCSNGMLLTDWGDNGHLQSSLSSWLGIIVGSIGGWNPNSLQEQNLNDDRLAQFVSLYFTRNDIDWLIGQCLIKSATIMEQCPINIPNMQFNLIPILYPSSFISEPLCDFVFRFMVLGFYPKRMVNWFLGPILSVYIHYCYYGKRVNYYIDEKCEELDKIRNEIEIEKKECKTRITLIMNLKLAKFSLLALRERVNDWTSFHKGTKLKMDENLIQEYIQIFQFESRPGYGMDESIFRLQRIGKNEI